MENLEPMIKVKAMTRIATSWWPLNFAKDYPSRVVRHFLGAATWNQSIGRSVDQLISKSLNRSVFDARRYNI